jgi:acyl-CoA dehydrogenase
LAHFGTSEQKEQFLEPLLRNEIVSCYSMTEPQGGADPKVFQTTAVQDGDEWIINGEKWFSSNARYSTFLIVMVVTDPDNPPYQQQSMFLVPTNTPGVEIIRNVGLGYESESEDHGSHAYVRYDNVRVPKENLLGPRGGGFIVAQTRLGGGRIHHAMRTSGRVRRIFDMMCERAISRTTQGELLSKKQMVQEMIADSWLEMEMFRLFVLRTAWRIDKYQDYKKVRKDISGVKAAMPGVYRNIATRALQIHGSLGVSWEMPFTKEVMESFHMGLADGPTEVHKVQVARRVLDDYVPCDDLFPSAHLPKQREAALLKYADVLERHLGTL